MRKADIIDYLNQFEDGEEITLDDLAVFCSEWEAMHEDKEETQ